jgi:hypothetical protein
MIMLRHSLPHGVCHALLLRQHVLVCIALQQLGELQKDV